MTRKVKEAALDNSSIWWQIAFWGLALILFYPPYFRGLFFKNEQQTTLILLSLVFFTAWLWKLSRREVSFLSRPIDYCAFGLVLAYLLAVLGAANLRLAIAETVKVSLYFLAYWLCSNLAYTERRVKQLLQVIYFSGLGVAWAGILTALGVIHINDGFLGGRIYSTLQYPNTLAIYLLALSFFGFYFWQVSTGFWKVMYSFGNYSLILVFLSTNSRGAFLVFPVVVLLFFLTNPKEKRFAFLTHFTITLIAVLIGSLKFIPLILAGNTGLASLWLILGMFIALGAQVVLNYLSSKNITLKYNLKTLRIVAIITLLLFIAFLLVLIFTQNDLAAKFLPEQLLHRLKSISLSDRNSQERLYWAKEAWNNIIKVRPILGLGGGAWESTYKSFQGYGYSSTQVHNDWIQLWTEVGTIGFALWVGLWLFFLLSSWKNYSREQGEQKLLQAAMTVAALAIGGHAMIDFDLSLSAVTIVLWSLFGLTRALTRSAESDYKILEPKTFVNLKFFYLSGVSLAVLLAIILSSSLLIGNSFARQAVAAVQENNPDQALDRFAKAAVFDPFQASFDIDMARIYLSKGEKNKAIALGERAVKKDRFNWQIYANLTEIYWQNGEIRKAVEAMETARDKARWAEAVYENLAKVYALGGISYLQQGKQAEAEKLFIKAKQLPANIEEQVAALTPKEKWLWETLGKPILSVAPQVKLNAGIACYFLKDWDKATLLLQDAAQREENQAEAYLWMALIQDKKGDADGATKLLQQAQDRNPEMVRNFKMLRQLPLIQ